MCIAVNCGLCALDEERLGPENVASWTCFRVTISAHAYVLLQLQDFFGTWGAYCSLIFSTTLCVSGLDSGRTDLTKFSKEMIPWWNVWLVIDENWILPPQLVFFVHKYTPLEGIFNTSLLETKFVVSLGNTVLVTFYFHTQWNNSSHVKQESVTLKNENKIFVTGLFDVTLEDMIGGRLWYISVRLQSHLLASGISSQLLHLQGRRVHKISKYFTAFCWICLYSHYVWALPVIYMTEWYLLGRQFVGEPWTWHYVLAWLRVISPLLSCMPTWT